MTKLKRIYCASQFPFVCVSIRKVFVTVLLFKKKKISFNQLLFLFSLHFSLSLLGVTVCIPQVNVLMSPLWLQLLSFSHSFVFSFFSSSSWLFDRRLLIQGQCYCSLCGFSLSLCSNAFINEVCTGGQ